MKRKKASSKKEKKKAESFNPEAKSLTKEEYWKMKEESLKPLGITPEDIKENKLKKMNRISETKNKQEKQPTLQEKAVILNLVIKTMPGKTWEEKVKNYEKLSKREVVDFLKKAKRRGSPSRTISKEETTIGIRKIIPSQKDALEELIEKNFNLKDESLIKKGRLKSPIKRIILMLEAAGIIKRKKMQRKIIILKPQKLQKTLETGYVQYPKKLKPIYKRKTKEEK